MSVAALLVVYLLLVVYVVYQSVIYATTQTRTLLNQVEHLAVCPNTVCPLVFEADLSAPSGLYHHSRRWPVIAFEWSLYASVMKTVRGVQLRGGEYACYELPPECGFRQEMYNVQASLESMGITVTTVSYRLTLDGRIFSDWNLEWKSHDTWPLNRKCDDDDLDTCTCVPGTRCVCGMS